MALQRACFLLVLSKSNCPLIGWGRSPLPNKACPSFGLHQCHRILHSLITLLMRLTTVMKMVLVAEVVAEEYKVWRTRPCGNEENETSRLQDIKPFQEIVYLPLSICGSAIMLLAWWINSNSIGIGLSDEHALDENFGCGCSSQRHLWSKRGLLHL